jgi:hypothetical protein
MKVKDFKNRMLKELEINTNKNKFMIDHEDDSFKKDI